MNTTTITESTLEVGGIRVPSRTTLLWWQRRGLSFTRSGYGRRIPTSRMVYLNGKWRRVYCCIFSNAGTCYVDGPRDTATGRRAWVIVTD
jgi:hypothetical protein